MSERDLLNENKYHLICVISYGKKAKGTSEWKDTNSSSFIQLSCIDYSQFLCVNKFMFISITNGFKVNSNVRLMTKVWIFKSQTCSRQMSSKKYFFSACLESLVACIHKVSLKAQGHLHFFLLCLKCMYEHAYHHSKADIVVWWSKINKKCRYFIFTFFVFHIFRRKKKYEKIFVLFRAVTNSWFFL